MTPEQATRPRVGIPWRTSEEERQGKREKLDHYFTSVRKAGGEPEAISLSLSAGELARQAEEFDGFVLPGSPADVDPAHYGAPRHAKTKVIDEARERTDNAILDLAIREEKPVLGICFGCQSLNVHQQGTLIQDIAEERPGRENSQAHGETDLAAGAKTGDQEHGATAEKESLIGRLAGTERLRINSSHHQAIEKTGKNLRVTATSEDGIVEAVEWAGSENWIVGVQWHPERMPEDPLAQKLFAEFVSAAKRARMLAGKR